MCFHTSQTKKVVFLEKRYDVELTNNDVRDTYDRPRYHLNGFIHPNLLIIPQEGPSALVPALWGIVPNNKTQAQIQEYYKDAVRYGGGLNAQSEKLFDHFIYKYSVLTRRCIIPVSGFFEPHEHQGKTYPFHVKHKDDDVLSLAGLYTIIDRVVTFTILTKQASPLFAKIHNKKERQPVILQKDTEQDWLKDDLNENRIKELIQSDFKEDDLITYPVSRDLFSPKVNSDVESILEKIEYQELPQVV